MCYLPVVVIACPFVARGIAWTIHGLCCVVVVVLVCKISMLMVAINGGGTSTDGADAERAEYWL